MSTYAFRPRALRSLSDEQASALVQAWLGLQLPPLHAQAQTQARAHLAAVAGLGGDGLGTRLGAFSAALEALHRATLQADDSTMPRQVQALVEQLGPQACPRAVRLAQAAWALAHLQLPQTWPRSRSLLQAQGSPAEDPRPPLERAWTDIALCAVHTQMGQYDAALCSGGLALEAARASGHGLLLAQAAQALGRCLLSAGDTSAALALGASVAAALQAPGAPSLQAHASQLLALVQAGRLTQAGQWLDQHAWLADAATPSGTPRLAAAVALVRASQGRSAQALALLEPAPAPPTALAPPTTGAASPIAASPAQVQCLWMQADAWRCLGQLARARQWLEPGLQLVQQPGLRLPSLEQAALHRVLGQVCEALGDGLAALQAQRRAQPPRHVWAAESRRWRQRVLQKPEPAEAARQPPFLALVAHELRNPLFGVQGMLSLLEGTALGPEQRQQLDIALRSSDLLLALCNDLLDLASLESGRFDLRPEPTDVAALLAHSVQSLQPRAQAQRLALSLQLSAQLPPLLCCDGRRLQQVVLNLLVNALKFTEQGSVRLEAGWQADAPAEPPAAGAPREPASGLLRLTVHDTGPGLSPQTQRQLFHGPLPLASGPLQTGAGLGLFICCQLARLMGGSIEYRRGKPVGSCFVVSLPLQLPPAVAS